MVTKITQETFDEAVAENVTEFSMSTEEAIQDAVKQFEAQGVDLSNIIKDLMLSDPENTQAISDALDKLSNLFKKKSQNQEVYVEQLTIIRDECGKGLEYRVYAGKHGAYNVIIDVLQKFHSNVETTKECLKALIALMTKQPDLLNSSGIEVINKLLSTQTDPEVQKLVLKWTKECCIMHELNRQNLFETSLLDNLKIILMDASSSVIRDALAVLRALVLDDDVRVEFGRSHEHARAIASDTLCNITSLLTKFQKDELLVSDLMITISSLLVRNEFCKKVEDAGGLNVIKEAMITFHDKDKIIRQGFKLLKALGGNDEVKAHIIQNDMAPVLASTLNRHKDSVQTVIAGLSCIAALTLRSADNSKAFYDAGTSDVIIDCMKFHGDDVGVQKNGSWAVRNMVSRSRYQNDKFLSLGIEDILIEDLGKFPAIEFDIKSALRDLGCNVNLKEEWTGKGGKLTTQSKTK